MSPVGFEPTISAGKRPQTYTLDRAATGTDEVASLLFANIKDVISMFATLSVPLHSEMLT